MPYKDTVLIDGLMSRIRDLGAVELAARQFLDYLRITHPQFFEAPHSSTLEDLLYTLETAKSLAKPKERDLATYHEEIRQAGLAATALTRSATPRELEPVPKAQRRKTAR